MEVKDFKNLKFWGGVISQCQMKGQHRIPEDLLEMGFKELGREDFKHLLKTALDTYCDPSQFQGEKAAALRNFRYQILKQIQELEKKWIGPVAQEPPSLSTKKASNSTSAVKLELVEDEPSSKNPPPSKDNDVDPWGANPL